MKNTVDGLTQGAMPCSWLIGDCVSHSRYTAGWDGVLFVLQMTSHVRK